MQPAALALACSLFLTSVATAVDSAAQAGPRQDPAVLHVTLSAPARRGLSEGQIRKAVSGKTLLLDEIGTLAPGIYLDVLVEGACPPVEKFFADGRWERTFCARAPRVYQGRWQIQTDRFGSLLCVAIDGGDALCRAVWRRGPPDRLILTVGPIRSSGTVAFNPYRTAPLLTDR